MYPAFDLALVMATDLIQTHGGSGIRSSSSVLDLPNSLNTPQFCSHVLGFYEEARQQGDQDAVDDLLVILLPAFAPAIDGLLSALCDRQHTDHDYWFGCEYWMARWRRLNLKGPQSVLDKHGAHAIWWNGEYRSTVSSFAAFRKFNAYSSDIERHLDRLRDTVLDSFDSVGRRKGHQPSRFKQWMNKRREENPGEPSYDLDPDEIFARLDDKDQEVCKLLYRLAPSRKPGQTCAELLHFQLRVPVSTAYDRIKRAKRNLRAILNEESLRRQAEFSGTISRTRVEGQQTAPLAA